MQYRSLRNAMRVLFVLGFFCARALSASASSGGLVISEIMYDPAGSDSNREWIEVYNSGSSGIDLAGHYLLTDGLSSSHHGLAAQGSSVIPAGGYAVIVQTVDGFKGDYPAFSGLIFDSSWTGLTATAGKTLAIIDSGSAVLDTVTYDPTIGATNDGNSLQRNASGTWATATPTPGVGSAGSGSDTTDTTDTGSSSTSDGSDTTGTTDTTDTTGTDTTGTGTDTGSTSDTSSDTTSGTDTSTSDTTTTNSNTDTGSTTNTNTNSDTTTTTSTTDSDNTGTNTNTTTSTSEVAVQAAPSAKGVAAKILRMKASLVTPKTGMAGISVNISSKVLGFQGEQCGYGVAHIAFGDGTEHDGIPGEVVQHIYQFPGAYVVRLEYRSYSYERSPDVVVRQTISVAAPAVRISRVTSEGSIELANPAKTEADLSGWTLGTIDGSVSFRLPAGTIILAGKKILLAKGVTGIPLGVPTLGLMLPSGAVAATYGDAPDTLLAETPSKPKKVVAASAARISAGIPLTATALAAGSPSELAAPIAKTSHKKHSALPLAIGAAGIIAAAGLLSIKFGVFGKMRAEDLLPENSLAPEEPQTAPESIRIIEE